MLAIHPKPLRLLMLVLPALMVSALHAQSAGDIRPVEPRWVAVKDAQTPLHCGPLTRFYVIAHADGGQVFRVDGESSKWLRVEYPLGLHPFVPASEAREINDTTIELTKDSGLRAPSRLMGLSGSWKSVYEVRLPAGMRLSVIKKQTNDDGEVLGYAIEAPRPPAATVQPYAYVKRSGVREATRREIGRAVAAMRPPVPEPEPVAITKPKPAAKHQANSDRDLSWGSVKEKAAEAVEKTVESITIDAADLTNAATNGVDTSLLEPMGEQATDPAPETVVDPVAVDEPKPVEDKEIERVVKAADTQNQPQTATPKPAAKIVRQEKTEPVTITPAVVTETKPVAPVEQPVIAPAMQQMPTLSEWDAGQREPIVEQPAPGTDLTGAPAIASADGEMPAADLAPEEISNSPTVDIKHATAIARTSVVDEYGLHPAGLDDLEATFNAARTLPREQLDDALDELLAEYQRAHAAAGQEPIRRALQQRIDWLNLRAQMRDSRRQIASTLTTTKVTTTATTYATPEQFVTQTGPIGGRSITGLIEPSSVYNGKRLPLMYRVRSSDPLIGPRTIGYVRTDQGEDLEPYIGRVVTIVGSASFDEQLRLTIITPEQVTAAGER